jgi:WD40 repeat protein
VLRGYHAWIAKIAFAPDGQWLAAKDRKGELRLWNFAAADVARSAISLRGHEGDIVQIAFTPDSRGLVTADEKGNIRLWDIDISRLIKRLQDAAGRDLSDDERETYQLMTE